MGLIVAWTEIDNFMLKSQDCTIEEFDFTVLHWHICRELKSENLNLFTDSASIAHT